MPVLIDLACCVLALQSPPVAEHLVPIPLDGWGAAVTETTVPLPEGGAAEPGALVELLPFLHMDLEWSSGTSRVEHGLDGPGVRLGA